MNTLHDAAIAAVTPSPTPEIVRNRDSPDAFTAEWWREWLLDVPLRLIILIVGALVIRFVVHKVIDRVVKRMAREGTASKEIAAQGAARVILGGATAVSERRNLRVKTLASLLKSISTALIVGIAAVMALDIIGYSIGPLLASAGILGVALGFGAQNIVKDFISGISMLAEDQYGVGDYIDMGEAEGTVESVGMRVTRLRSVDGTVWYVRNGEVIRIGNASQDWAQAVIDVRVAYEADTDEARRLLEDVAHTMYLEDPWNSLILEDPEVWGVQDLSPESVVLRLVVKTRPMEQWRVARQLRERIKERFEIEGIEIPFPQRTLWVRNDSQAEHQD